MKKNLNVIDWVYFKRTTIVLSVCVALGVMLALSSFFYVDAQRQLNQGSQAGLGGMKTKYEEAIHQLKLVDEYYAGYKELEKQGFVGNENRLVWVEALNSIAQLKKVTAIDYDIKPMKSYKPDYELGASLFLVNSSEMVLRMKLLHEHDLLYLFDELGRRTKSIFDIKKCNISRHNKKLKYNIDAVNITVECTLNWFTIKPKEKA